MPPTNTINSIMYTLIKLFTSISVPLVVKVYPQTHI